MLADVVSGEARFLLEARFFRGLFDDVAASISIKRAVPEFFTTDELRQLLQVIGQYWSKYHGIPKGPALREALNLTEGANAEKLYLVAKKIAVGEEFKVTIDQQLFILDQLEHLHRTKYYISSLQRAATFLEEYDPDKFEQAMLADIRTNRIRNGEELVEVIDYRKHWPARRQYIIEKQISLITEQTSILTGIKPLDDFIGEVGKTDLVIYGAVSGGGKSIALENTAVTNAMNGHQGVIVTIEMDPISKGFRIDSHLTRINSRNFFKRDLSKEQLEKADGIISQFREDMITIIHMPEVCTAELIKRELAILNKIKDIRWIVVDYAQLMQPSAQANGGDNLQWKVLGQVTAELKRLCNSLNVPIFTAVQLTEDARSMETITTKQLAFSKTASLKDANLFAAILQTEAMRLRDEAKIQILKFREGEINAELMIKPNYSIVRMHDV